MVHFLFKLCCAQIPLDTIHNQLYQPVVVAKVAAVVITVAVVAVAVVDTPVTGVATAVAGVAIAVALVAAAATGVATAVAVVAAAATGITTAVAVVDVADAVESSWTPFFFATASFFLEFFVSENLLGSIVRTGQPCRFMRCHLLRAIFYTP